jgi:hypothetical protein
LTTPFRGKLYQPFQKESEATGNGTQFSGLHALPETQFLALKIGYYGLLLPMIKLFVVGFPRMDEMELAQLFGPYGDIHLLTIARDQLSGKSKGFGFIQMAEQQGAEQSIKALNGYAFGDRQLEVRIAEEKLAPVSKPFSSPAPKYMPVAAGSGIKRNARVYLNNGFGTVQAGYFP